MRKYNTIKKGNNSLCKSKWKCIIKFYHIKLCFLSVKLILRIGKLITYLYFLMILCHILSSFSKN